MHVIATAVLPADRPPEWASPVDLDRWAATVEAASFNALALLADKNLSPAEWFRRLGEIPTGWVAREDRLRLWEAARGVCRDARVFGGMS